MNNFWAGTLPHGNLTLTRALADVTPSSVVMRLIPNTLYYQYQNLLSKYIERFWTADATLSSSQDCSFNDKALLLWEKRDF